MNAVWKYLLFIAGCVSAYFEPLGFLLRLVAVLFFADFVTGVIKSRKKCVIHYLLSVEFLKYIPMLNNFLKEKEDGKS